MENQKLPPLNSSLPFILSIGALAVLLLLAVHTQEILLKEFCKSLTLVACLNVFRVISNTSQIIEKQ